MKQAIIFLSATMAVLVSSSALARSVYLNGVDISAVRNKTFLKAEVTIDAAGNVRITAPQYDVKIIDGRAAEKTPNDRGGPNAALTRHYYLVTQPSERGRAQYDFSITVNGEEKKVIKAGSPQVILEMSKWLKKGENEVIIKATKDLSAGRRSSDSSDRAMVLIGLGHVENKIVKIDDVKTRVEVNAAQTEPSTKRYLLVAE
jgi:hypothetical protein